MFYKEYSNPSNVGWKGWIENGRGAAIGFVRLNGSILFEW